MIGNILDTIGAISIFLGALLALHDAAEHDDHERPHSALGYKPPAPQIKVPQIILNQPSLLQ